jgi:hypothetical protein
MSLLGKRAAANISTNTSQDLAETSDTVVLEKVKSKSFDMIGFA